LNRKQPPIPVPAFSAEVKYELSKEQIEDLIRAHAGFQDGVVEWDVSNKGKVRGVTVKVQRTEIRG
jgi:putative lipoic acid-binding regulatory protein